VIVIAAAVSFSGFGWLWPILIVASIALILVVISYARNPASGGVRAVCLVLKLLGIAALAVCLLEPMWSRTRPKPGANYFVVLADNSQGMRIKNRSAPKSRGEEMKDLLARNAWMQSLGDTFNVAQYTFDAQLQRVDGFGELDLNGSATSLAHALRNLTERFRTQPLAGVLLLTDGNATDMDDAFNAAELPPIYPVVIGKDDVPRDISLQRVSVSQTAFEDAPVTVQAEASAIGFSSDEIVVQVTDAAGKTVQERTVKPQSEKPANVRFLLKPPQRGISFYTVRAGARSELDATSTNVASSTEATLANNQRVVAIDRGSRAHRVLYVAGRPNWEFKFMNRALAEDEQLQVVALMRIAKREPKFEFIGRRGETGNPLFRGFGQNIEESERYDQPVLMRLNTRDEFELKGGFPKTAEELYGYDAIIIDDLEAEFFTRDQMMLVQRFVSERGGGLLMLGGAESFREGNFPRTPIGDMLPIYLDREREISKRQPVPFKLVLTREGWLQPWIRLRDNEKDERARIESMPAFDVINPAHDVKPGASVLATINDTQSGVQPAFVAQRFGSGRTAALLIGDLWHWGLKDEAMHKDMDKAWRQMMRWLVTDVPSLVELRVDEKSTPGAVALQVIARDKEFQPLDSATVQIHVTPVRAGETNTVRLMAESSSTSPGAYTASYIPRETGGYRAEAVVLNADGAEVGRAEAGWASDPAAEEFRSLKPNHALMEKLAKQTGGEVVTADGLERFVKSLQNRKAPVSETITQPLWHTAGMFLFALACFAGEWGVRRWKGLP
jgi:uncharacterized membrane protein